AAMEGEPERMVEARRPQVALDPPEIEEASADEIGDLRRLAQRDRTDGRALGIRDVERRTVGAEPQPARLRHGGVLGAARRQRLLTAADQARHLPRAQRQDTELMGAGIGEIEMIAGHLEIPGARRDRSWSRMPPRRAARRAARCRQASSL